MKRAIIELGHDTENEYNDMKSRSKNVFKERHSAINHYIQLEMAYEESLDKHKKAIFKSS